MGSASLCLGTLCTVAGGAPRCRRSPKIGRPATPGRTDGRFPSQVELRTVAGPQKSADRRRQDAQMADSRRRLAKKRGPATLLTPTCDTLPPPPATARGRTDNANTTCNISLNHLRHCAYPQHNRRPPPVEVAGTGPVVECRSCTPCISRATSWLSFPGSIRIMSGGSIYRPDWSRWPAFQNPYA